MWSPVASSSTTSRKMKKSFSYLPCPYFAAIKSNWKHKCFHYTGFGSSGDVIIFPDSWQRRSRVLASLGGHSNTFTFMCCHPQASDYRSLPKHGYLEYEILRTPYHRNRFLWQIKPPKWLPPSWHWFSLPRDIHFERKLDTPKSPILYLPPCHHTHTVNLYDLKFSLITKHYFYYTGCINSSYFFTIFDILIEGNGD